MEHSEVSEKVRHYAVMEKHGAYGAEPALRATDAKRADVIGFTSGIGGAGTTSTALMLAQNYSELCGMDTAYISLDLLASKACWQKGPSSEMLFGMFFTDSGVPDPKRLFVKDGCGVSRLPADGPRNPITLADPEDLIRIVEYMRPWFDKIIVDVPASCYQAPGILDACGCVVVCYGWQDKLYGPSEELYLMLAEEHGNVHRFFCFHDDEEPDLYGQLGSEVRRLAREI